MLPDASCYPLPSQPNGQRFTQHEAATRPRLLQGTSIVAVFIVEGK